MRDCKRISQLFPKRKQLVATIFIANAVNVGKFILKIEDMTTALIAADDWRVDYGKFRRTFSIGGSKLLKEIRETRGMSQNDLANATGIPKRMIQAYEQGYRNINGAKLSTLLTFANALNCPINQIVTDESLIAMINTYMNKL